MLYKINIQDRSYTKWCITDHDTFVERDIVINPLDLKLFNNDIFKMDEETKEVTIVHSTLRKSSPLPGVLILKGSKTYGRQNGKLLYKCIPDDVRIPHFLVPYEMKSMGFSKVFVNLYVTVAFTEWTDKHPHGVLSNVIGSVDILDNFYEYQLYCKSLNASIQKFTKDTSKALKTKAHDAFIDTICQKHPSIENRCGPEWYIFSIDPIGSSDYDDAFSIRTLKSGLCMLSIYISNVTVWMDVLNLWDSFSRRISTIYLPDHKRPMLPNILSECLCSLQQNTSRIAFVMDIVLNENDIVEIKYTNCKIRVAKNYNYEEATLIANPNYQTLLCVCQSLAESKYKYINKVRNSHELVCYLMIFMNYNCAMEMIKYKTGIFRSSFIKSGSKGGIPDDKLPDSVTNFIKFWNSTAGLYIDGSTMDDYKPTSFMRHDVLEMDAYIHITSPIRRLVDILNMIKFQQHCGLIKLSENASLFYDKWIKELEYINVTMRSIRRMQCDCSLLDYCINVPDVLEKEYDGYIFDKVTRTDCLYQFVVYLPELKMATRITIRENLENYQKNKYKLYLFQDEEKFKKKIRLHFLH